MRCSISHATLSLLSASLLATSGDITMTWTSPMYSKLYSNDTSVNPIGRSITQDEDTWIGSLINIGAIVGPIPFSFIAERLGRKVGLLSIAIPHIVAYLSMAFGTSVGIFYFGRVLGGIAVGGGYTLIPMYIAEVAEESKRGLFSVLLGVFWSVGNLLPNAIGPFLSVMWFNITMSLFPITFFILFFLIGYESPYYLVGLNRISEANDLLMKIRCGDKKSVEAELKEIQSNIESEEGGNITYILRNPALRKALIVSVCLIMFQQLSGINAISFYLIPIFDLTNTKMKSEISSLIVSIFIVLSSFVTPFLVDKFKRRTLLNFSYASMIIFLGTLGAFFFINNKTNINTDSLTFMPIFSLVLYIFTFQMGASVLPWAISSELFPKNVKQIAASVTSSACWITSFFVTKYFGAMLSAFGNYGSFWFFAGCCLVSVVFNIMFVPETLGKTFAEIQQIIRK